MSRGKGKGAAKNRYQSREKEKNRDTLSNITYEPIRSAGYRIDRRSRRRNAVGDNPEVLKVDNPRRLKVSKASNGKKNNTQACKGISLDRLATIPDLRIGREWYFRISSNGIVQLYFAGGATNIALTGSYVFTLGKVGAEYEFSRRTDLPARLWGDLALRMFGDRNAVDQVLVAARRAVHQHCLTRYRALDPSDFIRLNKKV